MIKVKLEGYIKFKKKTQKGYLFVIQTEDGQSQRVFSKVPFGEEGNKVSITASAALMFHSGGEDEKE